MGDSIELAWELSVSGAEDVKAKIADLHDQFNKGEIDVQQYSKGLRQAGSEYKSLASSADLAKREFLAQHPALASLSRNMSAFTSVLRTTLAVTNAINLAMIAMQGTTSNQLELEAELATAKRDYNKAVAENDVEGQEEAADRVSVAQAKLKEAMQQTANQALLTNITLASSFAFMAASVIGSLPDIVKGVRSMIKVLRELAVAQIIATATNPYVLLAVGVAVAAALIILYWDDIIAALKVAWEWITVTFGPAITATWNFLSETMGTVSLAIINAWAYIQSSLQTIWATINTGFTAFVNGIITVANFLIGAIASGIEGYVNAIISAINAMISVYNAAARAIGAGTIGNVGLISIGAPQIPLIPAAGGFSGMVNSPTLFLAGEGGQSEHVFISPSGRGGGGTEIHNHFHYNIQGSIWSEMGLKRVLDRRTMEDYRSRGIRGD